MKKLISLILIAVLMLSLTACGSTDSEGININDNYKGKFRVGYGKICITPKYSVALAGYGSTYTRMSLGKLDDIYAVCIAVSDEDNNTVLLYDIDLIGIGEAIGLTIRESVSKQTGIPADYIFLNCTHSHSAPDTAAEKDKAPSVTKYNSELMTWLARAGAQALNDRAPAEMYIGSTEASGLSFVRHYFDDNGLSVGDNHNSTGYGTIVRHTTEADPTLYLLRFAREDKNDIYYANWRAHNTKTGGSAYYDISSDFVGAFRIAFEEAMPDSYCAYYQGAAGNINPTSRIESEKPTDDYIEYGTLLAKFAADTAENLKKIENGKIKVSSQSFTANINHTQDSLAGYARIVKQVFSASNDPQAAVDAGKIYGIYSIFHANAIINKANMGATSKITISTITIGKSLALTFVPFEQFDTNGAWVEENSPYEWTVCQSYTNGRLGYIPSSYGYEYGCYEADTGDFAQGTGEEIAAELVNMLKKSKG